MSSDQHEREDQDDWSADASSLFRDARRAHDPTPLERASIDAVFARIQAGAHMPPSAAAARAPTRLWLGPTAKGSLAVLLLAAASFGGMRVLQQPSAPPRSEQPAPPWAAASETQPAATPRAEPSEPQPSKPPMTRRQDAPRARSPRHRPPANAASPRDTAAAVSGEPTSVTTLPHATTQPDRSEVVMAANPAAVSGDEPTSVATSPRTTTQPDSSAAATAANPPAAPQKPEAQAMTMAATRKLPPPPPAAPSELAFLKQMHAKLRESDYATVLTLCAEHARRWPHGVFELEREGVRAIASCGASSKDATRLASQFLTAYPRAALAMRVRAACAEQLPKK